MKNFGSFAKCRNNYRAIILLYSSGDNGRLLLLSCSIDAVLLLLLVLLLVLVVVGRDLHHRALVPGAKFQGDRCCCRARRAGRQGNRLASARRFGLTLVSWAAGIRRPDQLTTASASRRAKTSRYQLAARPRLLAAIRHCA